MIGEVKKNSNEMIRVSVKEFKDHRFIDCRTYFQDADGWKPSTKGMALNKKCIDEVITLLQKAREELFKISDNTQL